MENLARWMGRLFGRGINLIRRVNGWTMRLALALVLVMCIATPAFAQSAPPVAETVDINALLVAAGSLVGWGALIAVFVNIGKTLKFVTDGTAPIWVTGGNLIGMALLFIVKLIKPDLDVGQVDQMAGALSVMLGAILQFITMIASSKLTYMAVRGTPVIGKSYSKPAA